MTGWRYYIPRFYYRTLHNNDGGLDGYSGYVFGVACGRYNIHFELIRDSA